MWGGIKPIKDEGGKGGVRPINVAQERTILCVNIGIFIVLLILTVTFCLLGCLIFNNISGLFIGHLRDSIVKMMPNFGGGGAPNPGGPAGGPGGQPPYRPDSPVPQWVRTKRDESENDRYIQQEKDRMGLENDHWDVINKAHTQWIQKMKPEWAWYHPIYRFFEVKDSHFDLMCK